MPTLSLAGQLKEQARLLWRFLGFFQRPALRRLHAAIAMLIVLQILSSFGMRFITPDVMASGLFARFFSWYHILAGIATTVLGLLLVRDSLSNRGLRYFFPYLWNDTEQLKKDLIASLRFRMVPPRPKGLATAVQGLGLGALLLVSLSGLIWFLLWQDGSPAAESWRSLHKGFSLLIELYLLGHGGMALLHFFVWQKKTNARS